MAFTETWLNSSFNNHEYFTDHYQVFRSDNKPELSKKSRGGGVLLALGPNFTVIGQPTLYNTGVTDAVIVVTNFFHVILVFCCVYICPDSSLTEYEEFYNFCSSIICSIQKPDIKCIFFGDLNIPSLVNVQKTKTSCENSLELLNFLKLNNLSQQNTIVNKNGRLLDVVLSNVSLNVSHCSYPLVPEDAHHPSLDVACVLNVKRVFNILINDEPKFHYGKADFFKLYNVLGNTCFDEMYNTSDVNLACDNLYKLINNAMEESIPKTKRNFNPKFPIYYTQCIRRDIKEKQKLFKKLKTKNSKIKSRYHFLRKKIKYEIKIAFERYANECEISLRKDPKKVWDFTNSKLDKRNSFPNSMVFDGVSYSNPLTVADKFAEQFEKSYTTDDCCSDLVNLLLPSNTNNNNFLTNLITKDEVLASIRKLKSKSSCGPDRIPPFIVKGCAEHLASPLCYLFNLCLQRSVYPRMFKTSRVCPIYKKGDRHDGQNYRAVSILNVFSKCFEIILCDRLLSFVVSSIAPEQHGFVRGRSTVSNLTIFTSDILESFSKNYQVDTIYFDFTLAFDKVNHSLLLIKLLQNFDIPPYLSLLLKSYLLDRTQFVSYKNTKSKYFKVLSGIPQGSNLGPLLFCLFVNDIPKFVKNSKVLMYADDVKIYSEIKQEEDGENLQCDIDSLINWAELNKMTLNEKKCHVLSFTKRNGVHNSYILNGNKLNHCNKIKDLGLIIDSQLNYNDHVQDIVKSGNKIVGFLIRICHFLRTRIQF